MAQGDLTKEEEYDRIEVVQKWNIQVRKSVKVMEEQADGSKKELSRRFYRNTYTPYLSGKNPDGSWTHRETDISGFDATVKSVCNAIWTDDIKTAFKEMLIAAKS